MPSWLPLSFLRVLIIPWSTELDLLTSALCRHFGIIGRAHPGARHQETLTASDVIVDGARLPGLSAAVSAREAGARRVLILEIYVMICGPSFMSRVYFYADDPGRHKPLAIFHSPALMENPSLHVRRHTASPFTDAVACPILFRRASVDSKLCAHALERPTLSNPIHPFIARVTFHALC
jgi:Succinate dehydrogenase/fumarate reductase, flavoprotein subunit